jgi:PD-(D/E)XK endonuclease
MTTDQKGAIAEAAIALAALELGIEVYRPVAEGGRYDMIFDLGRELLRVQCKWGSAKGDVIIVHCNSTRRTANGFKRRPYSAAEIDAIAVYCGELRRCFLLPIERVDGQPVIALRFAACRNNQKRGVNWADEFDFAATLGRTQGAIAQLGERLDGIQKVAGSSPAGSTHSSDFLLS